MAILLQHLSITLVLGSAGISGFSFEGSCVPDCTDVTDGKIADPRNCRKYYTCHDDVATSVPIDCGIGNHFDDVMQVCVRGNCTPLAPCTPKCHFECKGLFNPTSASRTDCTKSVECFPGGTESHDCSNSPYIYFDGTNCQNDINKCCDPCMVYCPLGVSFVADPFNCTRYYYCEYASFFPEDEHLLKCPTGQYFNPYTELCTTDSSCDQLCGGSTPPTLSTTPPTLSTTPPTLSTTPPTLSTSPPTLTTSPPTLTTTPPTLTTTPPTLTTTPPTLTTTPPVLTTSPQTSDCHDTWLCTEYGYFPACSKHCSPRYFYCDNDHIGSLGEEHRCTDSQKVFHPDTVECVYPSQCPYDPEI